MSEEEKQPIEYVLGEQLASDKKILVKGESDPRRISNLNEAEAFAIAWFEQVPEKEGGEYAKKFVRDYMNLKMSIGGWRANQLIKLVAGSKGVASGKIVRRPGWIGRNVTNKKWREDAELEGADIIE